MIEIKEIDVVRFRVDDLIENGVDLHNVTYDDPALEMTKNLRDKTRRITENSPKLSDDDITKDLRFQLGMVHAFNMVLSLPANVRRHLDKLQDNK